MLSHHPLDRVLCPSSYKMQTLDSKHSKGNAGSTWPDPLTLPTPEHSSYDTLVVFKALPRSGVQTGNIPLDATSELVHLPNPTPAEPFAWS